MLPSLPITSTIKQLKSALSSGATVLSAPPGSGKTTIVPLALLDEPWLRGKKIIILQPRRIAARAACFRMAGLLGEKAGATVGYHIRHDRVCSKHTRIEVVTEGILTRRIQNDPDLSDVGLIIFDEFHERSIHADLALALCLDLCQINDQIRLLIMSATLDVAPIASLLGQVPIIEGTGKCYDVQVDYLENSPSRSVAATAAAGVLKVIIEKTGDILVFLPGVGDIVATEKYLNGIPECANLKIQSLYGNLSQRQQDIILYPENFDTRRIVLATAIAETSLTIEGIVNVIDSGWTKRPQYNPANGLTTLTTTRVSKASADQRSGRAGRLGPGYCLRLWDKTTHHSLPAYHPPEILQSDLSNLVLEILLWGATSPDELVWLDPPRESNYQKALSLLQSLDAVNGNRGLTKTGRAMVGYPMHPRLGRLMERASANNQTNLGADICALLSEKDIIDYRTKTTAELSLRLDLLKIFRAQNSKQSKQRLQQSCKIDLCRRVDQTSKSFLKIKKTTSVLSNQLSVASLLLFAYPDRLAQRIPEQFTRFKLVSGRVAHLPPGDPLTHSEFIVIASIDGGEKEGRIFLAEPIELSTIVEDHQNLITVHERVYWNDGKGKVIASKTLNVGCIPLKESMLQDVDQDDILRAVKKGIQMRGINSLLSSPKVLQLLSRITFLQNFQPQITLPDFSITSLENNLDWLEPYLTGITHINQLQKLNFYEILLARLDYNSQQQLDINAPLFYTVPTGSKIRIQYNNDDSPVLAVKIQELFGLVETPSICGGMVPLLLHLLSPAQRPIQITNDLKGFWENSYHDVKKDLKGRYPKHFWPDDPAAADATKYTKKRTKKIK
ncbi:ATP-dependent helicase HrpB [Desulforhopalus sp. 52FAK]